MRRVEAFYLLVGFEGADVVAGAGHGEGMDGAAGAEPGDEATRGVDAAAAFERFGDAGYVGGKVVVEGRTAPSAARLCGFFFHGEDKVARAYFGDAGFAKALRVLFFVAHYAGGAFAYCVAHEIGEAE